MEIFRHGGHRQPADLVDRGPAKHGAGPTVEAGVVDVAPWLNNVIEHVLLIGDVVGTLETILKDVGIEEMMRRLYLRDVRLAKIPERLIDKAADRHMVRVECHEQLARCLTERVVDVSRFGAPVVVPCDVANMQLTTELGHLRTPAIIE